jgi:putative endonuclease
VITRAQQRKIIKTAQFFLQKHPNYDDFDCRFDVICFDFPQKFAKTVQPDFSKLQYDQQWIQHAFTLD